MSLFAHTLTAHFLSVACLFFGLPLCFPINLQNIVILAKCAFLHLHTVHGETSLHSYRLVRPLHSLQTEDKVLLTMRLACAILNPTALRMA